ncbi:hypothetical protein [Kineosporia babensis]|uniref:Uncharacterized protein n=1 Tax=Kineosporia babensis TaxID=499548 RepID=A0A9X1NBA8_9ACTN|nr:hypothetical protein [Kineosporia babensis]MCD5310636.1 hypothetical protein [Kineosporia babensis]
MKTEDEVVDRLQRLAGQVSERSEPFPGVSTAIQRRRRRQITRNSGIALAGVVVAVVIGVETLTGSAFERPDQATVMSTPSATSTAQSVVEEAGYPGETRGTLAQDKEWIAELERRVRSSETELSNGSLKIASRHQVKVVAAGDLADHTRYAVVLYQADDRFRKNRWHRTFWLGQADSAAEDMLRNGGDDRSRTGDLPVEPKVLITTNDWITDPSKAVVIVSAPQAEAARIASGGSDRPLAEIAPGLWVDTVTKDEYRTGEVTLTVDGAPVEVERY